MTFSEALDLVAKGAQWAPGTQPRSYKHDPVVYYMRMDRLVKIGWSNHLKLRVASIQPQGVLAIEPGGASLEERRHMDFAALRSHREWFWLAGPLLGHIATLRDQLEAREGIATEAWLERLGVHQSPTYNQRPADD